MQQRKTIRSLSPARRLKFFLFLYWLHFCEIVESPVPPKIERFAIKLFCMTAAFVATLGFSVLVMQREPYIGLAIVLAYFGLIAVHAIYVAHMRLIRPRVYWVGE